MMRSPLSNTAFRLVVDVIIDLLIVYALYTVTRLLFVAANIGLYPDLTWGHCLHLLRAGLVFDSSAIFYTNALVIVMMLAPVHCKERPAYYRVVRWVYVVVNSLCLATNLCDTVYFPFTGKRTTMSVFSEFGNEGTGNLVTIICQQAAAHWWLVLVMVAIVAVLWWGFRAPGRLSRDSYPCRLARRLGITRWQWLRRAYRATHPAPTSPTGYTCPQLVRLYYVPLTVALAALAYLSVGMMRGGFTHAVRPITISNANQYIDRPAEAGIVLNTPFSLIRTIGKKNLVVPDYMPRDVADRYFSPVHLPVDSATFRPYNVVVIIVESFAKQHIGYYNIEKGENGPTGHKRSYTPFVDGLLSSGQALTYRHSYANGRKSIEGMPSVLSSIPNYVEPFFLTPASLNEISGIAGELSRHKGYNSAFFHGAENGSMGFEAFARSSGFQRYYGRTEYNADPRYHGDRDFDGTWAIWDEEFLQFFADKLSETPQPFVASVFTASSHTPFKLPARYDGKFPEGPSPLQRCIAYTDNALRLFFEKASKSPWYGNTIFVITADHTSQPVDDFYQTLTGHYAVPIIIYAPGIDLPTGYDTSTIAEQTDIMPTLLGIMGYDRPYIAFGQDLLTTAPEASHALHWVPENDTYEYIAHPLTASPALPTYALRFDGERITQAYDLDADPLQRRDILPTLAPEAVAPLDSTMRAVIQQYMLALTTDSLVVR